MDIWQLCSLQGTLFLMILIGAVLKKVGVIDDAGNRCLSDLCINLIIPCNILKSCFMKMDASILQSSGLIFGVAVFMQIFCLVINRFLFNRHEERQKKVLQYCTLVSNGGFLGNTVAEGIYGSLGLFYASVFLIPVRVVVWSAGTSYFIAGKTDKKKVIRNVLTNPCLAAVYIGLFLMITQIQLPTVFRSAVTYIGNCNSAITMLIIGTILADVDLRTMFNKTTLRFSVLRLVLIPAFTMLLCMLLPMDRTAAGVSVVMMGMPAGATAAIFAAKYGSDAEFATKCVVLSTLLSMITIPIWCYLIG